MPRPTSSAGTGRPFTASGSSGAFRPGSARPTTAAHGQQHQQTQYGGHAPQYTYSLDEEDEDEESEPEDVFAYLPPTTADQQPPSPSAASTSHSALYPPIADSHQFSYSTQSDLPSPHSPAPLLQQQLSHRPTTADAPFSHSHSAVPATPTDDYLTRPSYPPVETPPSTTNSNSHQEGNDSAFHMKKLEHSGTAPRTQSSREVRVSLPPSVNTGYEKGQDSGLGQDLESQEINVLPKHREALSSAGDSASGRALTPSILESEGSIKMAFDFDAVDEEDSPYPEVRASVSNIDDPEMPAMTLRMWVIGLGLLIIGTSMNVFFNFRNPSPQVLPTVLLLLAYPLGKLAAYILPITTYRIPSWVPFFRGYTFSLNPGPWNIKEHVLVFIMGNVSLQSPYALNAVVVADRIYGKKTDFWFDLTLVLATQITGFGLAGMCRRFLVWPASMVWPQNLVTCTLLNTLHAEDDTGSGGITRYRFFSWLCVGSFFWFFVPGYLFTGLSLFSWACWIAPKDVVVNQLFGTAYGLGMGVITFDWTQISWIGSPLMVPWWAQLHTFASFVIFYWICVPILYYTNTWKFAHFPIGSATPYDNMGKAYNVTRVLTKDQQLNVEAFDAYSPLYLSATYAMTYMLAFALSTAVLVHTALYHGPLLINGMKRIKIEKDDIHAKLMRNYPEVPDWWYLLSFAVFFSLAIVACEVWHTGVPVWALVLSVMLPCLYVVPSGFIFAMTSQGVNVNLLAQVIPGALIPGNPLANMIFKAYSIQTLAEAMSFTQDLKLGHYVKVPPRATFLVQMIATTLAAFVQVGVKTWLFTNVPRMCEEDNTAHLTCPHNRVFFTSSAVFGLIGPSRQFGPKSMYHPEVYALIVGALLPIPFWLWTRKRPNSIVQWLNIPVLLTGVMFIPPATGINYSSWFVVGFLFQFVIRRRNFTWWSKFNYITSAALDSGTAVAVIFIFFTLQLPNKDGKMDLNWWGNLVNENTLDWHNPVYRPVPEGNKI